MVPLEKASGWGWSPEKPSDWGKRKGIGVRWARRLSTLKTTEQDLITLQIGEHILHARRVTHPSSMRTEAPTFQIWLFVPLHLAVHLNPLQ